MKITGIGSNGSSVFIIVALAVILLIVFGCVFGFFYFGKKENFDNGCRQNKTYDDPNFKNERFFHYDNIDRLVSSDPVHVPREVVESALYSKDDADNYFGDAKKKRQ